ncbi:MAG: hypothetical protein QXQ46_08990 [Thermoplasmatales archaeon]
MYNLSIEFTAFTLVPSTAMSWDVNRSCPLRNRLNLLKIDLTVYILSFLKSEIVLKSGMSLRIGHITSILQLHPFSSFLYDLMLL